MVDFCVKLTQTPLEPPTVLRASLRDRVRAGQPHDAGGHPFRTSSQISDFLTPSPLVRKLMQPPLLRLLTMSAFEGTPSTPQSGRHKWKPPYSLARQRDN